jgi:hypothetical protein
MNYAGRCTLGASAVGHFERGQRELHARPDRIAQTTEAPIGTVMSRLARARRRLTETFGGKSYECAVPTPANEISCSGE